MKRKLFIATLLIAGSLASFAQKTKSEIFSELKDSLSSRYGVSLGVPKKYEAIVFDHMPTWTQWDGSKGHFIVIIAAAIESKDQKLALLLSPVTAFNKQRIEKEKKAGKYYLKREMKYISPTLEMKTKVLSETTSLVWCDIPKDLTLFSNAFPDFPGVDDKNNPTELQKLYLERYNYLRRYYYIQKDRPPLEFIVLTSSPAEKQNRKIEKAINKMLGIK